ncbi:unnamed protein product [Periconia digitata]|uniref:Uncharacterized protein n=1 Tax=Periconia digitata TaxID=1303443 RepID=A0A9W4U2K7_9PLEO|nr:unnamed protein product [Periconia digitata]
MTFFSFAACDSGQDRILQAPYGSSVSSSTDQYDRGANSDAFRIFQFMVAIAFQIESIPHTNGALLVVSRIQRCNIATNPPRELTKAQDQA